MKHWCGSCEKYLLTWNYSSKWIFTTYCAAAKLWINMNYHLRQTDYTISITLHLVEELRVNKIA